MNTVLAALARGEGAAGFDSASAVINKTRDAGSFAMCLDRLGINDRAGVEITGSRSPSEGGTTIGSMDPDLRADLGLGEGEDAPLLRSVSHGVARETVKAMVSRGGAKVVWTHGRHGAGEGEHAAWLGADSYQDVADVIGEYAERTLGGRFAIGAVGGVSVGVASWNGVGKTVVVTQMLHASYPLAVVHNGDAGGTSGVSASLHFAGANTAVVLAIASLLGTRLPNSLQESCAGWLLLGDGGVVGRANSIMGTIGATADLSAKTLAHPAHRRTVQSGKVPLRGNVNKTAAERGGTKSTNESKADGARTATVDGQKVAVREGVWQGREAATPTEEAAMRQRSADSASGGKIGGLQTGGAGNPHGSSKNTGLGEADRQAVCVAGYTDERETFGICLGVATSGFKKRLKDLVEPSGRIVVETLCNRPNFPEPGRTLNKTPWTKNSTGQLVLGYHNGNASTAHAMHLAGGAETRR